ILIIIISAFLLSACSTMPSGPSVLVLPSADKNFDQFHNEDQLCRNLTHKQVAAAQEDIDSKDEAQQNYDIVYIQCMYSKGHQVPVPGVMYGMQQEEELDQPPPADAPMDMPAPPQATNPKRR
ncbi:MAG: hypothetical protein ACXV8P_09445, partial [Methylobacter sp.]